MKFFSSSLHQLGGKPKVSRSIADSSTGAGPWDQHTISYGGDVSYLQADGCQELVKTRSTPRLPPESMTILHA